MPKWWIGCSGFHYKHWKGIFYPDKLAQSKWFGYYCEHFNTIELNVTFYRFPRLNVLQNWYKLSPEQFKFAVKAPRVITHYKKFTASEKMLSDFYDTVQGGLQEKLGAVLFQMAPKFIYKPEYLERIIRCLDKNFENVLEFRHSSWWNEEVFRILARENIGFCSMSHPDLPDTMPGKSKVFYERFHGVPELYKSSYSNKQLKTFAAHVTRDNNIKTAYVYFNNDIGGSAVFNAKELIEITANTKKKTKAPLK